MTPKVALPTRLGWLNLTDPAATADEQFIASKTITKPLVDLIAAKNNTYPTCMVFLRIKSSQK